MDVIQSNIKNKKQNKKKNAGLRNMTEILLIFIWK